MEVTKEVPVEFRYVKDIYFGDKRMELNVVPAVFGDGDAPPGGDSAGAATARPSSARFTSR